MRVSCFWHSHCELTVVTTSPSFFIAFLLVIIFFQLTPMTTEEWLFCKPHHIILRQHFSIVLPSSSSSGYPVLYIYIYINVLVSNAPPEALFLLACNIQLLSLTGPFDTWHCNFMIMLYHLRPPLPAPFSQHCIMFCGKFAPRERCIKLTFVSIFPLHFNFLSV